MADNGPGRRRSTNALALVAGALIALIAVLGFLALISHRAGAEEATAPAPYETVSVPAPAL